MNLEIVGKRLYLKATILLCYLTFATEIVAEPKPSESEELKKMLVAIERTTRATRFYTDVKTISDDVMQALSKVNRAQFVPT